MSAESPDPSLQPELDVSGGRGAPPLDRRRVALWAAALATVLAVYFAPAFPWPTNRFDTGIPLVAADRILAGELPYVDFQTLYTPGFYYLVAGAFRLFGRSFEVFHFTSLAVVLANIVIAFLVAWRLARTPLRAGVSVMAGVAGAYPYAAIAPSLIGLMVAVDGRRPTVLRALFAGAFAGVAAWFRHDIGAFAALAVMVALWTRVRSLQRTPEGSPDGPKPTGWRSAWGLALLAGTSAAAVLAILLSPALVLAPKRLFAGLITNPMATVPYREGSGSLVKALTEFGATGPVFFACVVLTLLGLLAALAPRRARAFLDPQVPIGLFAGVAVLALWALRYFVLRPETHHILPATLLVGVLGAVRWRGSLRWLSIGRVLWLVVVACLVVPFYRSVGSRALEVLGRRTSTVTSLAPSVSGADRVYLPNQEIASYRALLAHLERTVPAGEPIFSACERHDFIHAQDLLLYFVADRPAVVFDHHFDPGVTTRADVQRGIVADLVDHEVRTIVRTRSRLPAGSKDWEPGSRILDDWIATHFEAGPSFGRYRVWTRR